MRRTLIAIVLGLALSAGILGFSVDESSGAHSTTPRSGQPLSSADWRLPPSSPPSAFPAAHDDSNTDNDETVYLNQNVIDGRATTICTRSTNPRLVQVLQKAIGIWHETLSPDANGDGDIDADALFGYHVFQQVTTPACAGADVEVMENTILVNASSIQVECMNGVFDPAVSGSPRACYRKRDQKSPPRKQFQWEEAPMGSGLHDRAVVIYQAISHDPNSPDHVGTMVHELGHVLGLSHYDDADHCDQLRDDSVDPLGDHFTAMSYRPRAGTEACETNGVITGRDLRDLYEAYHIGPLTGVKMKGAVTVTSSKRVSAAFFWGKAGAEELGHNAKYIMAQRKSEGGWETVASTSAFDDNGALREMIDVIHCGGISSQYRLLGASAFRMGLKAFVEEYSLVAPLAMFAGKPPSTCGTSTGSTTGVQVAIGDPTLVVGVAAWNGKDDDDDWCAGKDNCPPVLSASLTQSYCFTRAVRPTITYMASGGESDSAPNIAITGGHLPQQTLKAPPPVPQCHLTEGPASFMVTARWGLKADDPALSLALPVRVVAKPMPVGAINESGGIGVSVLIEPAHESPRVRT